MTAADARRNNDVSRSTVSGNLIQSALATGRGRPTTNLAAWRLDCRGFEDRGSGGGQWAPRPPLAIKEEWQDSGFPRKGVF